MGMIKSNSFHEIYMAEMFTSFRAHGNVSTKEILDFLNYSRPLKNNLLLDIKIDERSVFSRHHSYFPLCSTSIRISKYSMPAFHGKLLPIYNMPSEQLGFKNLFIANTSGFHLTFFKDCSKCLKTTTKHHIPIFKIKASAKLGTTKMFLNLCEP